jgi:hypothetical protein
MKHPTTTTDPATDSFDRDRANGSAEVTWWRAATDDGRDTARARALAAGTVRPAPGFEYLAVSS